MEGTSKLNPNALEFYPSRMSYYVAAFEASLNGNPLKIPTFLSPPPPPLPPPAQLSPALEPLVLQYPPLQPPQFFNDPTVLIPSNPLNNALAPSPVAADPPACKVVRNSLHPVAAGPRHQERGSRLGRRGGRGQAFGRGRGGGGGRRGIVDGNTNGAGKRCDGRKWKNSGVYQEIIPLDPKGNATSVMIRNIPNNYTRKLLVDFLENHCKNENEKDDNKNAVRSAFDFVYLPIDFKHRLNAGFAFVNFTSSEAAWRFHEAIKGKRWDLFESKKTADVTRAKIQGKEALIRNCERMKLCSPSPEYLPVWFDPPLDGSGNPPSSTTTTTSTSSSSSTMKMHTIGNACKG